LACFYIESIDHIIDAKWGQEWRLSLFCYVQDTLVVDVNVNGAKKLVHISL
jgi:hypothetical protein